MSLLMANHPQELVIRQDVSFEQLTSTRGLTLIV